MSMGESPRSRRGSRFLGEGDGSAGFSARMAWGGVGLAAILGIVVSIVSSAVVYFTGLDERAMSSVLNVGTFLVLGVSGFVTARRARSHGLLYGLAVGFGYVVVTLALSFSMFSPFPGLAALMKRAVFALLAGAIGGVMGVNY